MKDKNRPLKIAILDHNPEIGGAEVSILTLCKHIDRSRFNPAVVLPSRGSFSRRLEELNIHSEEIRLPIELIRLKRGDIFRSVSWILAYLFYIQFFLVRLCIYLKKNKFDLVVTNTVKAHLYGSMAAYLCRIALVWRFHDVLSPDDFSPALIRVVAFFGRCFPKKILAVSKTTKEYLVKSGLKQDKIDVIMNGIDSELFEMRGVSEDIRKELRIEGKTRLVGCIGRIMEQKGQKSFLLAIPRVIPKWPETLFLIVGDVFSGREGYKKELLEIIDKNGLRDYVRFIGFKENIGDVIKSLDVLVFPSVAPESFGLSVLEAMSFGKPVIASNTGGVSEIIQDGVTGLLFEPGHPEQIAERIILLLDQRESYDAIGKGAKEAVTERFSLEKYVTTMEQALMEVADG